MPKYCYICESGGYKWTNRDGFSRGRGEYVYNWDNSTYKREEEESRRREEEERRRLFDDDDDDD